jgi:hypothetical protein
VLQKSLGVTEGRLREMSKEGKLSREAIVKAVLAAKGLKPPPATFASGWQKFKDDMMVVFGKMAQDKNLMESFAAVLGVLAGALTILAKVLGTVIGLVSDFVKGLKDGEIWAYALAATLGLMLIPKLMSLVAWLFKIPAILRAITAEKKLAMAADWAQIGGGLGIVGGKGSVPGKGGTGVTGGSSTGLLLGLAAFVGEALPPLAIAYALSEITGGAIGDDPANKALLSQIPWMPGYTGTPSVNAPGSPASTSSVSVGPTTVNIYSKDMNDAQAQFSAEMIERTHRHAIAGGG